MRRLFPKIMKEKTALIDHACREIGIRSFADLGGVWGVHGAYTFYGLKSGRIDKAYLADTDFTAIVKLRRLLYPQLQLVRGNFGNPDVARSIGAVDTIFLFDVLLHQVAPDWDEIIRMYAKKTNSFIIYNQQYIGSKTVRLLELGEDEYFRNVPHSRNLGEYNTLFTKLDQIHPLHQRPYRDIFNIWQWGITDDDLVRVMMEQGFARYYYKNYGQWGGLRNFEGHAFIFLRQQ